MPRFSKHFGLGLNQHELDFVDITTQRDAPVYVDPYAIAVVYAGLGDFDRTFEWLEQAFEERATWLTLFVKCDPRFDALRSDRRFGDLLRRMGFAR